MNPTDRLLKSLPHIRSLFGDDEFQKVNTRYELFDNSSISKDKRVQRLSVTNAFDYDLEYINGGSRISNMYYHQLMYNSTSDDKKRRLDDYRSMANYPEVERALTEIVNEFFEKDDKGRYAKFDLLGDYNDEVKTLIEEEFYHFLEVFKFDEKGSRTIRDWLIEGEVFFENIVSIKKPELGIIGVTRISSDRCDPLYYDLDNELIDCFLLRAKSPDMYPFQWGKFTAQASYGTNHQHQLLFMNDKQITYIANDQWSDGKKFKLPVLHYAHRPYRQLSLIEDATVIYMLVRAPERLVFTVDVGNMQPSKAEQYMKRLMGQFWSKKTMSRDGRIENVYDPQGMLENYWFPVREGGKGSDVKSIGGGKASPDNLEILNYFVQKLYQSLKVPLSRLNSEAAFSDGENITREELAFAEYIINIQKLWAAALKKSFIVHLKLKGKKILESAKKLNIDKIMIRGGNIPQNSFQVSQVFKDSFTNKCWDNYDLLAEEVLDTLEVLHENVNSQKERIEKEAKIIEETLAKLDEGVITESEEFNHAVLEKSLEGVYEELQYIEEQQTDLNEINSDMLSWWEQYDLREEDIHVKFVEPSQFFALREQQLFNIKYENFNNMSQNDFVSNTLALKMYLGWTDKEILTNLDMLRKDAAFRWELAQIEQNGPDFREKALEEIQGTAMAGGEGGEIGLGGLGGGGGPPGLPSAGAGGGGGGGAGGGGPESLPDFGTPPPAGTEGGPPAEGGAEAEGGEEGPTPPPTA
jgi:hypothetical protein